MIDLFNTYQSTRIYLAIGTFSTILAGYTTTKPFQNNKNLLLMTRTLLLIVSLSLLFSTYLFYQYNFNINKNKNYTIRFQEYLAMFYTIILALLIIISLAFSFF